MRPIGKIIDDFCLNQFEQSLEEMAFDIPLVSSRVSSNTSRQTDSDYDLVELLSRPLAQNGRHVLA